MQFHNTISVSCDVLIVGGGGAALRAAIEAKELGVDVVVVSKSNVGYGNNTIISKGIFAATGWGDQQDDDKVHLKDTMSGGRFLNDQKLVALATQQAQTQVDFLEKCGVQFLKKEGRLKLGSTPGHSYPRHINVVERSGKGLILPMKEYAEKIGVRFHNKVFVTKLFTDDGKIQGVAGIDAAGNLIAFQAKCVILATGGFAQIFQKTNNAGGITGDGHMLALEAGVSLKDMEFVQFYPTTIGKSGSKILLYEAIVASLGAVVRNAKRENILEKHGMQTPVEMTRDRVTRAIMQEILAGQDVDRGVVLDLSPVSPKSSLKRLLPSSWTENQTELIVSPSTHFCMGGIIVDEKTETSMQGLFGAGEICAGVHGANRLGGNALAEVFALGGVSGRYAAALAKKVEPSDFPEAALEEERSRLASFMEGKEHSREPILEVLKNQMWCNAGIIRSGKDLTETLNKIDGLMESFLTLHVASPSQLIKHLELQNMLSISQIVCKTALLRTESRGAHYRIDHPQEDNQNWLKNIVVDKSGAEIKLNSMAVSPEQDLNDN